MRKLTKWMMAPVMLLAAAACGRGDAPRADDALKNDLALASQVQPYQPQQFVSPMEQWNGANPYQQPYMQPGYYPAPQVVQTATRAPVRRTSTSTARRSTSSGSRSSGSRVGTVQRAPTVKRNTKRDAAIGAAAGAVIGATTSRDRVKGAVIGGVAGAVLGGIIGHTVDVQKTP